MASLRRELRFNNQAERVWDALRDFQAVHTRVAPGFVVASRPDGDARRITFSNGQEARELLVDCDDARRRLVYAIADGPATTYSASVQVFADGDRQCRLVWIVDLLPNALADYISSQMDLAAATMQTTLERQ